MESWRKRKEKKKKKKKKEKKRKKENQPTNGGLECETAASGTTLQYKGKM